MAYLILILTCIFALLAGWAIGGRLNDHHPNKTTTMPDMQEAIQTIPGQETETMRESLLQAAVSSGMAKRI
jgi:hypothetical protein